MSEHLHFFQAFLRSSSHVGAIAPSSRKLADKMLDWLEWEGMQAILEYGPGTGVVTEAIGERLRPGMQFFAVERDPRLAKMARQRCPGLTIHESCVTNVPELCRDSGIGQVDAIVSGLPWASFPPALQDRVLEAMFEVLPPGGKFATFAYWQGLLLPGGQRFRQFLRANFSIVEQSTTTWANLPPAFVYCCER